MKIREHFSENYGLVNYVEVAAIDMSKDKSHLVEFHPKFVSFTKRRGDDSRMEKIKNNPQISEHDKDDYGYFYCSVFELPLEVCNKDWHIVNKDFKPDDEYLSNIKKKKYCPIAVSHETFINWFIKIYPYLNDEWKENNKEYMAEMDRVILENNRRMLQGFKEENIKEIRAAVKLGADINFSENGASPLLYCIEGKNINLFKYLVNKSVKINSDVFVDESNPIFNEFNTYQSRLKKKMKI